MITRLSVPRRTLTTQEQVLHDACVAGVVTGIYASHGGQILEAPQSEYTKAIRAAGRVAVEQADEIIRRTRSAA